MFLANLRRGDSVIAAMAREFLQTASRGPGGRYANYRGSRQRPFLLLLRNFMVKAGFGTLFSGWDMRFCGIVHGL